MKALWAVRPTVFGLLGTGLPLLRADTQIIDFAIKAPNEAHTREGIRNDLHSKSIIPIAKRL